jgi:hypothetical protein
MRFVPPLLSAFATLCSATVLHAAPMYKCVFNGRVAYQQAPCPSSEIRKEPTLEELNDAERKRRVPSQATKAPTVPGTAPSPHEFSRPALPASPSSHRCDGRVRCSQMTSCAEAKFFLQSCPGVKMDGDGDGIPCEDQLCGH